MLCRPWPSFTVMILFALAHDNFRSLQVHQAMAVVARSGTGDDHMKFAWLMRLNNLDPRSLNPRHLAVPDIETEMEKVPRRAMKQYRTPGVPNVRKMLTCGHTQLRFRVDALCKVLKRISPGRNSCFSQTANNSSSIFSSRRASVLPNKQ